MEKQFQTWNTLQATSAEKYKKEYYTSTAGSKVERESETDTSCTSADSLGELDGDEVRGETRLEG